MQRNRTERPAISMRTFVLGGLLTPNQWLPRQKPVASFNRSAASSSTKEQQLVSPVSLEQTPGGLTLEDVPGGGDNEHPIGQGWRCLNPWKTSPPPPIERVPLKRGARRKSHTRQRAEYQCYPWCKTTPPPVGTVYPSDTESYYFSDLVKYGSAAASLLSLPAEVGGDSISEKRSNIHRR